MKQAQKCGGMVDGVCVWEGGGATTTPLTEPDWSKHEIT